MGSVSHRDNRKVNGIPLRSIRRLSATKLALKKHAEGVIKAYAEGRQIAQWAIIELRNDRQKAKGCELFL